MNDVFYYFGFLYIAFRLRNLIMNFIPDKETEEMLENTSKEISGDFSSFNKKDWNIIKQVYKKAFFKFSNIANTIFLIWIIIGIYIEQYHNHFLCILSIVIVSYFISALSPYIRNKKNKITPQNILTETKNHIKDKRLIVVNITEILIKVSIVSHVLYQHFFTAV